MSRAVFVVPDARGVAEVFARRHEAHRFAQDLAGARVTRHVLRRSDDAFVLFDRRVVVAGGHTRSDETTQVNHFCDEAFTLPVADVERYHVIRLPNGTSPHSAQMRSRSTSRCSRRSITSEYPEPVDENSRVLGIAFERAPSQVPTLAPRLIPDGGWVTRRARWPGRRFLDSQRECRPRADEMVKSCAGRAAVDGLSLALDRGKILALLDPNGAGKTTIEFCEGSRLADSGTVRVLGLDRARDSAASSSVQRVGAREEKGK